MDICPDFAELVCTAGNLASTNKIHVGYDGRCIPVAQHWLGLA